MAGSCPNGFVAVLPITHADATAFAARFLADPSDRLGRLVFADWLEEQGGDANELWARYLRYMAHAEDDFDGVFRQRADSLGRAVRARLTLPMLPGNHLLPWLTAFLPAHRIWVGVGEVRIPREVVEWCPESVARRFEVMAIGVDRTTVYLARSTLSDHDGARDTLRLILNREVVMFRGSPSDVSNALNNHYGWPDVQWATEILETPPNEAG